MSKAYVKEIGQNTDDSQQMSPSWMLTFVRWTNRDTLRMQAQDAAKDLSVRQPLVVINDCVSVVTSMVKTSQTPSFQATLKLGDINYLTAVAPGDFVFVNILEDQGRIDDLYRKATNRQAINGVDDGFKGFFKVQSVRRVVGVNPDTGARQIMARIDGFAFTEFNNSIYFNPFLVNEPEFKKDAIFVTNVGLNYKQLTGGGRVPGVQEINSFFIENFLGSGVPPDRKSFSGADTNFNTLFYVPTLVGELLGQPRAQAAKDLYFYVMGIQKYGSGGQNLGVAMNPLNLKQSRGRFYFTSQPCQGVSLLKPEYWNQVPVWSILKQYLNSPVNEMYNCFRVGPNNRVMPTLVMRQMPFSTESYGGVGTKFLNLPRWKIDTRTIYDIDIGRDEAARINFVQVFGLAVNSDKPDAMVSFQIQKKNYVSDVADIKRSGLRPYVITSNFDSIEFSGGNPKELKAVTWSRLLGDALIGGQLKLNGSITVSGIEAPITIGDNLELDGIVYHIESVTHQCQVMGNGLKQFRTSIQLSNGIDKDWSEKQPRYAEMENSDVDLERQKQYDNDEIFTGWSDEQFIPGRSGSIKTKINNQSFTLAKRKTTTSPSSSKVLKKSKKVQK